VPELARGWRSLSIRQPWIELILSGAKTIEIRRWRDAPLVRGLFVLHAARALDWKTVELFQWDDPLALRRGGFVGVAELVEVLPISSATNWRALLMEHRVVHPPPFDRTVWGLRLRSARAFERPVKARGHGDFFEVPAGARRGVATQLARLGLNPAQPAAEGAALAESLQSAEQAAKEPGV
jgi:ASCH domain